jgi:outer membrane protein OmpA-like peptidoglycan-associated protein
MLLCVSGRAGAQELTADQVAERLRAALAVSATEAKPAVKAKARPGATRSIFEDNGVDNERDPKTLTPPPPAAPTRPAPPAPAPAPTLAGTASPPAGTAVQGCVPSGVEFHTLPFARNSAELGTTRKSLKTLAELARALKLDEFRGARFHIRGHTDSTGTARINLPLSLRRAEAVISALDKLGAPSEEMVAEGLGATDPKDPIHPAAAINRRVDICVEPRA